MIAAALHLPPLWKFRVLAGLSAGGRLEHRRLLAAWARAEGGTARWNPLNTTMPWAGATSYNSVGVRNYRTPADGIAATVATLELHYYAGIVKDLRLGVFSAQQIVERNAHEFDVWGTGHANVLRCL